MRREWREAFRVLKAGGHLLVLCGANADLTAIAVRLAKSAIRDALAYLSGGRLEPMLVARKPLDGTVAANVLWHGYGGLHVDACRVPGAVTFFDHHGTGSKHGYSGAIKGGTFGGVREGRWPANVVQDGSAAVEDGLAASGWRQGGVRTVTSRPGRVYGGGGLPAHTATFSLGSGGTAARRHGARPVVSPKARTQSASLGRAHATIRSAMQAADLL